MNKAVLIWIGAVLTVAGAGGYYWFQQHAAGEKQNAKNHAVTASASPSSSKTGGSSAPAQRPPQPVTVWEIRPREVSFSYKLPGRVSPYRQSQVRPQVDGIITERLFEEGSYVEKGQQLYQIDDARYKAELNRAQADLESAKANVKTIEARESRYRELLKINAVSEQEYDDVKAGLDQARASVAVAEAAVDLARVNLGYTKVYAPIAGRTGRSFVTEGALVTANQSHYLTTITQLNPVYIDMQQSGEEALRLRTQMVGKETFPVRVHFEADSLEEYPHEGRLKFSEVTVDETTGSVALRAVVPNPENILLPGMFVRTTLDLGEDVVMLVPQRATIRNPDGSLTLWVVDGDGLAQPRQIKVDRAYKEFWVVSEGVAPADTIIVEGYQKVGPGTPVRPEPWQGSFSVGGQAFNEIPTAAGPDNQENRSEK